QGTAKVADRVHPSTKGLPERWERPEEWYNFDTFECPPPGGHSNAVAVSIRPGRRASTTVSPRSGARPSSRRPWSARAIERRECRR
ncbi:hypothetical protein ACWCRC_31925, partial [Streptomyces sp. NPDC001940]